MISSDRIARLPEFGERARGSVWALSRFPLVNYLPVACHALTAPSEGGRRGHVNGVGVVQSHGLRVLTEHAHHPG